MKILARKAALSTAALALTIMSASPTVADDTELLLIAPSGSQIPKPNVMFILDTSGSMGTVENTAEPYDSETAYSGKCDANKLYWTDAGIEPTCDGTNTRNIDKSSFVCDLAVNQITEIGSFTNAMVQYRSVAGGAPAWTTIEAGNSSDPVECQRDSGRHGDGTPTFVYAASGSGLAYPWTDDHLQEIAWGSAPRNISYSVYDGNYLNWRASPLSVNLTRNQIMIDVVKKVLSSATDMNVGVMRFNNLDGGPVIEAVQDLDTNRLAILGTIDKLPAIGRSPLSETMYEAALYWLGEPAYYGERINETSTDPSALAQASPEVYARPGVDACAKNYNVLLTDGEPVGDEETPELAPTLPDFASVLGRAACTLNAMGDCLDDVTEYLGKVDTDANQVGDQTVITHTIGFTVDLPILKDAAAASGGQYFLADDVESLTAALLEIIASINDHSLSFSAPAVSVNTFNRTQHLNDLYLTVFGAAGKVHWPGNVKKLRLENTLLVDANGNPAINPNTGLFYDNTRSIWTSANDGADGNDVRLGGAANRLPDPAVRNVYTNNVGTDLTATTNAIASSNAVNFTPADFGLSGAADEPTVDEIIRWMRGEDIRDEDGDGITTVRNAMGDSLHSRPAALVYGGTPSSPEVVVYAATNDGYLHAIDGSTGTELWSFIPRQLLPRMGRLYFDPDSSFKDYGLDGNVIPVVKDVNGNGIVDGADFVVLLVGMRRGGTKFYALDVSNKNAPRLLWTQSLAIGGQSWSTPTIAKIDVAGATQNADNAVVILGGGYDPVHDTAHHPTTPDGQGAGVHFLDLISGTTLWRGGMDAGASRQFSGMTRSIPTQVKAIDTNGDDLADRMYASDMGGQIWRFDIDNGQAAATLVNGGVIAQLGAEGLATPAIEDTRRFYTSPDIALFTDPRLDRQFIAVSIGSGYRAHPLDTSVTDRFFSLRDPNIFDALTQAQYDSYPIATDASLLEVAGKKQVRLTQNDRGWRFTLPTNQMILSDSITFDNSVFFVAFSPDIDVAASCAPGRGSNFVYRVSIVNGDPVVNNLDALDPDDTDDARRQTLAQGGIAPSPTVIFPSPHDPSCSESSCNPPPIICFGVECLDPGYANYPVRTLWTQDGIQ